jgi:hypothetical protein
VQKIYFMYKAARVSGLSINTQLAVRPRSAGERKSAVEQQFAKCDLVEPTAIEHRYDEISEGDGVEQRYNYIVYHFDCSNSYVWARTYLDEIDTLSVYGPFERRGSTQRMPEPLDDAVLFYFKRRFRRIKIFQNGSYVTVWQR